MAIFRIHIRNRDFTVTNDSELPGDEAAKKQAMRGALEIGADEICGGKPFFGAEVLIERDGETIERLVIALGASTLQ